MAINFNGTEIENVIYKSNSLEAFSGSAVCTDNAIVADLDGLANYIRIQVSTNRYITYDASDGTDRYKYGLDTNPEIKYFSTEGGYVNNTGFKFLVSGFNDTKCYYNGTLRKEINLDKVIFNDVVVWENWKHNPSGTLHNKTEVSATSGGYCECFINFDKPTKIKHIKGYSDFAGGSNFNSTMNIWIWASDNSFSKKNIRSWSQTTRTSWSWDIPTEYNEIELSKIMYSWTLSNIAHSTELWVDDYYQKG